MKTDTILIKQADGTFDIEWENGELKFTEGLDTALALSFYGEKRASASEMSRPERRRGWIGNDLSGIRGYEVGNKLWLLSQAKAIQGNLNLATSYLRSGFNWLIEDKLLKNINIQGEIVNNEGFKFDIQFINSNDEIINRQYTLWENTKLNLGE